MNRAASCGIRIRSGDLDRSQVCAQCSPFSRLDFLSRRTADATRSRAARLLIPRMRATRLQETPLIRRLNALRCFGVRLRRSTPPPFRAGFRAPRVGGCGCVHDLGMGSLAPGPSGFPEDVRDHASQPRSQRAVRVRPTQRGLSVVEDPHERLRCGVFRIRRTPGPQPPHDRVYFFAGQDPGVLEPALVDEADQVPDRRIFRSHRTSPFSIDLPSSRLYERRRWSQQRRGG